MTKWHENTGPKRGYCGSHFSRIMYTDDHNLGIDHQAAKLDITIVGLRFNLQKSAMGKHPAATICKRPAAKVAAKSPRKSQRALVVSPWNKGKKSNKTDTQHLFIPRAEVELFFAVLLYWAGPVYAVSVWLCMITSRRISESLRVRRSDIFLHGGEHSDSAHVLYMLREEESTMAGCGKLGSDILVARISTSSVETLQVLIDKGLERQVLPVLA